MSFHLEYGSRLTGMCVYDLIEHEDGSFRFRGLRTAAGYFSFAFDVPMEAPELLFHVLISVEKWKEHYMTGEASGDNTFKWQIECYHDTLNIYSKGEDAYPLDFNTRMETICRELIRIVERYGEEYVEDLDEVIELMAY